MLRLYFLLFEVSNMTRKFLLLLLPLCALFLASSCGPSSATINKMRTERMAKVGTSPFMPPLAYQKGQEYVGPDAVLANRLVEKMHAEWLEGDAATRKIRLVHVARKTSELASALKNSEADLIISGYEVTDARKQELDFSDSYYTSELMLAINPFVNKAITTANMKGQKIGVRAGSGAEEIVKSKGGDAVALGTLDDCVLALKSGEVSAVVDDKYMLAYALDTLPASSHLEISPTTVASLDCAVAARKGEEELIKFVNEAIKNAKSEYATALEEHDAERLTKVMARQPKRLKDEANKAKPRNITICVQRGPGSTFDIYRMANLSFSLGNYSTSRIQFSGKVGCASVSAPPGRYMLEQRRFGFGAPIVISETDPNSVRITVTIKADGNTSVSKS